MTKRIGILTSGGDCGGLNAAIRAVALARPSWLRLDDGGPAQRHARTAGAAGRGCRARSRTSRCGVGAPGRHLSRQHQSRRSLRLSHARWRQEGPLGRDDRRPQGAGARRADRHRWRRQPRHPAPPADADRALPSSVSRRPSTTTSPTPSVPSAIRRRSPSPPRRSIACSRPAPATSVSWCWR